MIIESKISNDFQEMAKIEKNPLKSLSTFICLMLCFDCSATTKKNSMSVCQDILSCHRAILNVNKHKTI